MLFILLILPTSAQAADSFSMGTALMQMLWALLIVIGLILVIYGLAKKRFGIGQLNNGNIKVIELRHIMPRTSLALIEVEKRRFLVGIASGHIELLADFPDTSSDRQNFDTHLAEQQ